MADQSPLVRSSAVTQQIQSASDAFVVFAGGDSRGGGAVDLQMTRSLSTQVAAALYSGILSGSQNLIDNGSQWGVIAGGFSSDILSNSDYAVIGGGVNNAVSASTGGAVLSGSSNSVDDSSNYCVIGGGVSNQITDQGIESVICGGRDNVINDTYTTDPDYCFIGGGINNEIDGTAYAVIGGGSGNVIDETCTYSAILGGRTNTISGLAIQCSIGGGYLNSIDAANNCTILGGVNHTISGEAGASSICGGDDNTITGSSNYITIAGGLSNTIGSTGDAVQYSTIVGGRSNTIEDNNSLYCTIGGGWGNRIYSSKTTASGNQWSVILGGRDNTIDDSLGACIPYGRDNTVGTDHNYALAEGYYAQSLEYGTQTFSMHQIGSTDGTAQVHRTIMTRQTTNATANLPLYVNYPATTIAGLPINDNRAYHIRVHLVAIQDDGSAAAVFEGSTGVRKDGAAAATGLATTGLPFSLTKVDDDTVSWTARVGLSSNTIQVQVTGVAATTINWTAEVIVVETSATS